MSPTQIKKAQKQSRNWGFLYFIYLFSKQASIVPRPRDIAIYDLAWNLWGAMLYLLWRSVPAAPKILSERRAIVHSLCNSWAGSDYVGGRDFLQARTTFWRYSPVKLPTSWLNFSSPPTILLFFQDATLSPLCNTNRPFISNLFLQKFCPRRKRLARLLFWL